MAAHEELEEIFRLIYKKDTSYWFSYYSVTSPTFLLHTEQKRYYLSFNTFKHLSSCEKFIYFLQK